MRNQQNNTGALSALLRTADGVDTLVKNSLCCAAAGIIAPPSSTAGALTPHEKLRGAALVDATLTAPERPLAQPALGYTHASNAVEYPPESKPDQRYWPTDLTNVLPDEWAVMSPKHVAEFAGVTEVWMLLEAAQKRISELEQVNSNLRECAVALNIDSDAPNELLLVPLLKREISTTQLARAAPLYTKQFAPLAGEGREKAINEISEAINRMPYTRKHLAESLYEAGYRKQVPR